MRAQAALAREPIAGAHRPRRDAAGVVVGLERDLGLERDAGEPPEQRAHEDAPHGGTELRAVRELETHRAGEGEHPLAQRDRRQDPGLLLVASGPARAAPEVVVEDPGKHLSSADQGLVARATDLALARLPGTEAARCAFRNSWRGAPSKDAWEKDMGFLRRQERVIVSVLASNGQTGSDRGELALRRRRQDRFGQKVW
jgi:hypothetical protein